MRQSTAAILLKCGLRMGLPMAILAGCLFLLAQKLGGLEMARLPDHLRAISAIQWAGAGAFTLGSFWAVGQYDAFAHRALGTGIGQNQARLSGTIGIALGQTLGFGLFTGALARWRMLPALSISEALRLSTFVSLSFVAAWMVVTSVLCLILPAPTWTTWPAAFVMTALILGSWGMFRRPRLKWRARQIPLPSLKLVGAIVLWAAIDTTCAAAAFYVLLPTHEIGFFSFLPLFLIALGAALVSNTPGGVGPFELIMLSALPQAAPELVITAIVSYRVVYYAIPASLAMLALLRPCSAPAKRTHRQTPSHKISARSEIGAILQNGGHVQGDLGSASALWPTGQTLTLFADPLCGSPEIAVKNLTQAARQTTKVPMIYKCSGPTAAAARKAGWSVLHMADDAIVDLARYDHTIPMRRTLRRKLRNAEKAGVVLRANTPASLSEMAVIDEKWQQAHGTARGGSMGRFCTRYIADQWTVCAYRDGALIAFITVHMGVQEWCLDLMRHNDDIPDGTMHSLVDSAIAAARAAGAQKFCLAATPACPDPHSAIWRWASRQAVVRTGGPGLRQFKSTFAPRWSARYAAAPDPLQLGLGLADLAQEILNPRPLTAIHSNKPHYVDEDYELASRRTA